MIPAVQGSWLPGGPGSCRTWPAHAVAAPISSSVAGAASYAQVAGAAAAQRQASSQPLLGGGFGAPEEWLQAAATGPSEHQQQPEPDQVRRAAQAQAQSQPQPAGEATAVVAEQSSPQQEAALGLSPTDGRSAAPIGAGFSAGRSARHDGLDENLAQTGEEGDQG